MLEVITAFFLLIFHSIVYLFSSGETKQIAKNHIKEINHGFCTLRLQLLM
ncbi:hypothetical protein ABH959_005728 [Bacillus sp. RC51]